MSALNTTLVTPEVATEFLRKMREIALSSADEHQCWTRLVGAVSGCVGNDVPPVNLLVFPRRAA